MTDWSLSYCRKDARFTLANDSGRTEHFSMWVLYQVWDFIRNNLEPGDTLHYLKDENDG